MHHVKLFLLAYLFLSCVVVQAQNQCRCEDALKNLITKIESDYPGFSDKIKDTLLYSSFKQKLLDQSKKTQSEDCFTLLKSYTQFFQDGHIYLTAKGVPAKRTEVVRSKKLSIKMDDFMKHLSKTTDYVEGVWSSGDYRVGIVREGKGYAAFIIEADTTWWKPFEVKFTINSSDSLNYFMKDHTPAKCPYKFHDKAILQVNQVNTFYVKEYPIPNLSKAELGARISELKGEVFCKAISDQTVLLRIASFNYPYVAQINQMLTDSKGLLETHPNLIIDLRDNGGGTSVAFSGLMPYLYTNPVRNMGAEYLSTPTYISSLKKYLNRMAPQEYEKEQKRINAHISRLEGNVGGYINASETGNEVFIDSSGVKLLNPKNIVILINRNCASATEDFLLKAKQSKKVKVMGTRTYGGLDYGNQYEFDFGCEGYRLLLPTFRSKRLPDYPIDNVGIQPDIYLDKTVTSWVEYAKSYLEN